MDCADLVARLAQLRCAGLGLLGQHIGDDDAAAVRCQRACELKAQPTGAAGDEDAAALQQGLGSRGVGSTRHLVLQRIIVSYAVHLSTAYLAFQDEGQGLTLMYMLESTVDTPFASSILPFHYRFIVFLVKR